MGTTISGDTGVVFPDATTQSTAVTVATPFSINASAGAGAQLRLPEATANGVNYVAVKAADALSSNVTWTLPTADGTSGQFLQTNGSGALAFAGLSSPLEVVGNSTAGAEIRLPEDTDNGNNYVALKAANALAANLTFTLPAVDGTNGQYLQTNGSGTLSFTSVPVQRYELISTTTASGASSLDFVNLSDTYSEYIIVSRNFIASANSAFNVRTSTNNGSSYDSGVNQYVLTQMRVDTSGTISGFTTQLTEIQTGFTWTTNPNYFRLHLVNAGVSTYPIVETTIGLTVPNAQHARTIGWRQSTTAINAMRLFPSSGTISGTFYLYGVRA